jgi:hypothetical protein
MARLEVVFWRHGKIFSAKLGILFTTLKKVRFCGKSVCLIRFETSERGISQLGSMSIPKAVVLLVSIPRRLRKTNKHHWPIRVGNARKPISTTILTQPRVTFLDGASGKRGGWMWVLAVEDAGLFYHSTLSVDFCRSSARGRGLVQSTRDRSALKSRKLSIELPR